MNPAGVDLRALATLAADPDRVARVPREAVPDLLAEIEALRVRLWQRAVQPHSSNTTSANADPKERDRLLTVKDAARLLGVKPEWVYRRADRLPFTRRLSPRTLRFSERGIERWLKTRP